MSSAFSRRIPELDGVRGLAVLAILLYHLVFLAGWSRLPFRIGALLSFGWSGVDLFFVLSGFLIGGILLDARDASNYFRVFYTRRAYRILPLYLALCGTSVLIFYTHLPTHHWLFEGKTPWYAYLTFGQNFWMVKDTIDSRQLDMTWSLAVEEQFYLTLPLVIRFVRREALPYVFAAGVLLAPLIRTAVWLSVPAYRDSITYLLAPCRMDALLLGVLAAYGVRNDATLGWLVGHAKLLRWTAIVLALGLAGLTRAHIARESLIFTSLGYTWVAAFYLLLLILAVTQKGIISTLFRFPPIMKLGILAYGLYLLHQPVMGLVYGLAGRDSPSLGPWPPEWIPLGLMSIAAITVIVLANISWEYFEEPLVRRGHHFRYRLPANPVSQPSAAPVAPPNSRPASASCLDAS